MERHWISEVSHGETRRIAEEIQKLFYNLLPGSFNTARLRGGLLRTAKNRGVTESVAENEAREEIPAKRFGTPEEFGQTCAFLCSVHAGYITGQNILLDGGAYPGAF